VNEAFAPIARLITQESGLSFSEARVASAEATIRRMMSAAGFDDPARYLLRLENSVADREVLIAELTVGETYFFREPQHFALLKELRPSTVWSAGCASGEEAYSIAMTSSAATILASDISRPVLEKAREASYRAWSMRGVAPEIIERHFTRAEDRYQLDRAIVRRVRFEHFNLAQEIYPPRSFDAILCRNVLIYFDAPTAERVGRRLAESLVPGGVLITGPSDPPLFEEPLLEPVVLPSMIYYRRLVPKR
jgi:chemotaxis protein methyltransferase CheR